MQGLVKVIKYFNSTTKKIMSISLVRIENLIYLQNIDGFIGIGNYAATDLDMLISIIEREIKGRGFYMSCFVLCATPFSNFSRCTNINFPYYNQRLSNYVECRMKEILKSTNEI